MIKILFIAGANSHNLPFLDLAEEHRQIQLAMLQLYDPQPFSLISCWAARANDVVRQLLREQPHIVHFSGHGELGIVLLNDHGDPEIVSTEKFVEILRIVRDNIRMVVLNTCCEKELVAVLTDVADLAVVMDGKTCDLAAIRFSGNFYYALGCGRTVTEAFELASAASQWAGTFAASLVCRPGVDPTFFRFVEPPVPLAGGHSIRRRIPRFARVWERLNSLLGRTG